MVRTGLDRLILGGASAAGLPRGARVGLLAHPASVDARARHAADLLAAHPDFRLVRLFGPEHGIRGEAQDMEAVAESSDRATGLPVVSLYGDTEASLKPSPADLADLDVLVHDLQDVGSRYYTFVYTLAHAMEAAAEAGLPVVVLDRPNPIGGLAVEGPVLEPPFRSFVGRYPIPVRHGLTTGELAVLFRDAFGVRCDLRVVSMEGWRRAAHFEDTGLPWVAPSPNMPTPETARVYPGGCLVEGTNLSEGRGTTRPFELTGAPWLDGAALARVLTGESLPGVLFRAASFRPEFQKHARRLCEGVQVHVADRAIFRPFATYLALLREARRQDPLAFDWRRDAYEFVRDRLAIDLLLGKAGLREMLEGGASTEDMEASWAEDLARFAPERARVLLYGP
ncbi:MAG TPA: DUF1343 domain-containing protein [Candidatus Polarisedimenticolaceae bacterium]|nr:DUF1343 domain-containing protein [Candidatus Polarisedimenticolaceae bacterium]